MGYYIVDADTNEILRFTDDLPSAEQEAEKFHRSIKIIRGEIVDYATRERPAHIPAMGSGESA